MYQGAERIVNIEDGAFVLQCIYITNTCIWIRNTVASKDLHN